MTLKTMNYLPSIEKEIQRQISRLNEPLTSSLHEMLTYHLGWSGENADPKTRGKRIRPLFLLLSCSACGGDWKPALPAAAAVELVHNFSLIHDDIQDNSEKRRGRDTVWAKWGIPQAINAGDALFILSSQALFDLVPDFSHEIVSRAANILNSACLNLTRGQFLDIYYEKKSDLSLEGYWSMVSGKTAALLSACCALGSLLGNCDQATLDAYGSFGHYLGLAYQVHDDYLGIWGESRLTGKSSHSDLVSGKNSLPILYGLGKGGPFARRWAEAPIRADEVADLSEQLAAEGARLFVQETADQMTDMAMQSLRIANPKGKAGEQLIELAKNLLNRDS
jgi:geranylgeranyl diphosphate synthase type I